MNDKNVHEGRNVKRIREMLGIKQDALAMELGLSQQAVSALEQKEALDKEMLEKIAQVLRVPAESIKNFNEQAAINIVATTFTSHDNSTSVAYQSSFNFNPLDKYIEQVEENKKLYQALLKEKDEKIMLLEKLLNKQ